MIRAIVLAVALAITPAVAQPIRNYIAGPEFLNNCTAKSRERHIACVAFIAGVVDAYIAAQQFCIPPQVQPPEIADFAIDYALRIARNETPVRMIVLALKAKWPCIGQTGFPPPFEWHNGR
jgi:hypothetical protein